MCFFVTVLNGYVPDSVPRILVSLRWNFIVNIIINIGMIILLCIKNENIYTQQYSRGNMFGMHIGCSYKERIQQMWQNLVRYKITNKGYNRKCATGTYTSQLCQICGVSSKDHLATYMKITKVRIKLICILKVGWTFDKAFVFKYI
jgi:hypothetical protein